ncbi:MAG: allophanate hydrolase [Dehalococcoidia bacterium]|jgi:KipI family sensor histidine kinase inhibitor|nr:allophanate hydrolase [Dehalococcoidia bacterium]
MDEIKVNTSPVFAPMGDSALMVVAGNSISVEVNEKVHNMISIIKEQDWPGIKEIVPTYSSFVIHFDPFIFSSDGLIACVADLWDCKEVSEETKTKTVLIPTLYGSDYGLDLESVSEFTNLSVEEVIDIHSETEYLVYALGFSPGFPYLGGLDPRIHCPRLETPRISVPKGSVAIADSQTGVYPVSSPGGWRLIGQTPVTMFDPDRSDPSIVNPGDYIRFVPISSESEFEEIFEMSANGSYEVEVK